MEILVYLFLQVQLDIMGQKIDKNFFYNEEPILQGRLIFAQPGYIFMRFFLNTQI